METLLTLMICHAEASFIAAIYRICSIGFDPSFVSFDHGTYTAEEAMVLLSIAIRSIGDMFMGINFFIGIVRKNQNSKYADWVKYGLITIIMDCFFIAVLVQKNRYSGLEIFFVSVDAFVKSCIVVVMHNLRTDLISAPIPTARLEKQALLPK